MRMVGGGGFGLAWSVHLLSLADLAFPSNKSLMCVVSTSNNLTDTTNQS
jgi:hypothetical protein